MTLKAWFLRWLNTTSVSELKEALEEDASRIRRETEDSIALAVAELRTEYESAMAKLIEELNTLRNSIPGTAAQNAQGQVRVLRNFREFRETIEHPRQKKGTA